MHRLRTKFIAGVAWWIGFRAPRDEIAGESPASSIFMASCVLLRRSTMRSASPQPRTVSEQQTPDPLEKLTPTLWNNVVEAARSK